MPIRTILVDDEPFARRYLRGLLAADGDFELVAECAAGLEAARAIVEHQPDLVVLDIQMPEVDGFGVLHAIRGQADPLVVFCTAHDHYAMKAFDAFALDYLLKPFDEDRFTRMLARVKAQIHGAAAAEKHRTAALVERVAAERPAPERLLVKTGGRVLFLRFADIRYIEADDNYVRVFTPDGEHVMREALSRMERLLPSPPFVRIHRSTVVNFELVRELHPLPTGEARLILNDETELTVSRRFRDKLPDRFSPG